MAPRRPVIGIAFPKPDDLTSLDRAGAEARVLDPAIDTLPAALDDLDGVLLTGGVDVDPRHYGEAAHPTVRVDTTRDDYELPLARLALARRLPLLAICRGVQVLNVAAGGSLVQDLPSQAPSPVAHAINVPKDALAHDVDVQPGTRLAALIGAGPTPANSRHHQAVSTVAPGFVVSATAPDGVIEAIEQAGAPFCVGVQWHPENFWESRRFSALFDGLVTAARQHGR